MPLRLFWLLVLLMILLPWLSGCEPISSLSLQPPAPPSAFCLERQELGEEVRVDFDEEGTGHYAYARGGTVFIATTRPGDTPVAIPGISADRLEDLAVDAHGNRYLLFESPGLGRMAYAHDREGSWQLFPLVQGMPLSIQVEPAGGVHVFFALPVRGEDSVELKHMTKRSGEWLIETVIQDCSLYSAKLSVDELGHAHALCYVLPNQEEPGVRRIYASNATGTWRTEDVFHDSAMQAAHFAADVEGTAHLLYRGEYQRIYHATKVAGSWQHSQTPLWLKATSNISSLQVGPDGALHSLIHDAFLGFTQHLTLANGTWSATPLVLTPSEDERRLGELGEVRLAFDAQHRLVLGYDRHRYFEATTLFRAGYVALPRDCL